METFGRSDILSSATFETVFANSPFADRSERIRSTLREAHFQYLENKLVGERVQHEVNYALLEEVAYYLSGVASTPGRAEEVESALKAEILSVSALVFEYLGDLASQEIQASSELDSSALYYLDACICNTLGVYEANTIALARKYLLKRHSLDEILHDSYPLFSQSDCQNILYAWLAREIPFLWIRHRSIENILERTLSTLNTKLVDGSVSRRVYAEMRYWLALVAAVTFHSRFFQFGKNDYLIQVEEQFAFAVDLAQKQNNPPLVWTSYALHECAKKMGSNSVWTRLSTICPSKYLRSLVTSISPVLELWSSQLEAIAASPPRGYTNADEKLEYGIFDQRVRRVVVGMPTSAGKTLLAEVGIIRSLFPDPTKSKPVANRTCIYVVPSLALVNQVEAKLQSRLLPLGLRVTAVVGGYDAAQLDDALLDKTRVAVLTPEKLDMLVRQDHLFVQRCGLFIFDELHKVSDLGRGLTLELTITWLKDFHPQAKQAKMIFMSAAMPNMTQIAEWVADQETSSNNVPVLPLTVSWQPTRQVKGYFDIDDTDLIDRIENSKEIIYSYGGHLTYVYDEHDLTQPRQIRRLIETKEYLRKSTRRKTREVYLTKDTKKSFGVEENAAEVAKRFAKARLDPILVFFMTREETRSFCNYFVAEDYSPRDLNERELGEFNIFVQYLSERLGIYHPLVQFVRRGIAYHHGYLPQDVRAEIEYAFSRRWIRVMASTTTLTDGVNFPISTFILANYEQVVGFEPTTKTRIRRVLEKKDFRNMVGRAGRAVFDTEGQIVFMLPLAQTPNYGLWRDYFFPRSDDADWQVRSSVEHPEFKRKVLWGIIESLRNPDDAINSLFVDPELLDSNFGFGARKVGETVLRLQAFLLAMTDREVIDPGNLQTIQKFFRRMLLGQEQQDSELLSLITDFTQLTAQTLTRAEPDKTRRAFYGKIGLGFTSARAIYSRAVEFWAAHKENLGNDFLSDSFITEIADFLFSLPELRPSRVKIPHKNPIKYLSLPHGEILSKWIIDSATLTAICEGYFKETKDLGERAELAASYIRDAFEYKAPWALSAFYTLLEAVSQRDNFGGTTLGKQLSMLPAYAKFGVNNPAAAFFSMMGVRVRQTAILLGKYFNIENQAKDFDFAAMLDWLLELEPEQVADWFKTEHGEDRAGQVPRLFRLLESIREQQQTLTDILPINAPIAGWQYYGGSKIISEVRVGDHLTLRPDSLNPWDQFAVEVLDPHGRKLGMIPKDFSRAVTLHLSSDLPLQCTVTHIDETERFHPVRIELGAPEA